MLTTEKQLELTKKKLRFVEAWLNQQGKILEEKYDDKKAANLCFMLWEFVQCISYQSEEEFEPLYNEVMKDYK